MKSLDFSQYDPTLQYAITDAVGRIERSLATQMPLSKSYVRDWLTYLSGTDNPADYYHRVSISPMFWFPWFLEKMLNSATDPLLQPDLVYSTINGYYYIRLIDNLADHHATVELEILPSLGFFHTQFQMPYQKHFAHDHPFWNFFSDIWFHSADVTIMDTKSVDQDRNHFVHIASQKICAIKIPLAAVAYHYGHSELIQAWAQLVDSFGRWHQMHSDIFHWHEDLSQGVATFFLSEAHQRKLSDESLADWVLREGFQWGLDLLNEWMVEIQKEAPKLGSKELVQYLSYRQANSQKAGREVIKALNSASKISSLLL